MEKEKHNIHFNDKKDLYETFLGKFNNRQEKIAENVASSLLGKLRVEEISVHQVGQTGKQDQKIDIATIRKSQKVFADTYEISGLLYNHMLEKAGFVEVSYQSGKNFDNTQFLFYPNDPQIAAHFTQYLERLALSEEETAFFKDFPTYFNNPSFGVVEEEPGNIHRMIYADKIPIGVYMQKDKYLGLIFNKHNKMYELRLQKFLQVDYDKPEIKYVEAENLTPSLFGCFENVYKYVPKEGEGMSSSIFGTSKTKTIVVRSVDQPNNETLQVVLGVGLKSHLKHQERTHMQYEGLAFNRFTGKVCNLKIFTERLYEGMGAMKVQSRVEYLPNNPEKLKQFIYQLETLIGKQDLEFFQKRLIPFFANLSLGERIIGGEVTHLYPIFADGVEIGSYLVNTKKLNHNYRGLMVKDPAAKQLVFQNSLYNFTGKFCVK